MPLPAELVQPFTVCVTVKVADVVTVMEAVVAPVFHKNEAVGAPLAVNTVLPQLLVTETRGAAGVDFGAAVPLAVGLLQPFTVCATV